GRRRRLHRDHAEVAALDDIHRAGPRAEASVGMRLDPSPLELQRLGQREHRALQLLAALIAAELALLLHRRNDRVEGVALGQLQHHLGAAAFRGSDEEGALALADGDEALTELRREGEGGERQTLSLDAL